jgi:hypothetical protein
MHLRETLAPFETLETRTVSLTWTHTSPTTVAAVADETMIVIHRSEIETNDPPNVTVLPLSVTDVLLSGMIATLGPPLTTNNVRESVNTGTETTQAGENGTAITDAHAVAVLHPCETTVIVIATDLGRGTGTFTADELAIASPWGKSVKREEKGTTRE